MPDEFKIAYSALWDFVKDPVNNIPSTSKITEKLKIFFSILLLELTLTVFLVLIIKGLENFNLISLKDHKVQILIKNAPAYIIFVVFAVIAPFVEEVFFRLSLRFKEKNMHLNVLILIGGISLLLISAFKINYIKISIIAIGMILWLIYLTKKAKYNQLILSFWNRKFLYVFYFSVISFGALHIFNYKPSVNTFLFSPLLILPQLILGLFCGYIRLKLGFLWGCFLHVAHNFIIFIPIFITALVSLSHTNSTKIIEQNNCIDYMRISNDTIDISGARLGNIIPALLSLKKEYIEFKDSSFANKILAIHYARKTKGYTKGKLNSSRSIVLFDLLTKYHLKIEKITFDKYIYQIQIVDSMKLNLYTQDQNDTLMTWTIPTFEDNEIILHNANLSLFAKTINQNYDYEVVNSSNNHNHYTIKIPKLEFEGLNQFMTEQYGIKFNKSNDKVVGYKISKAQ